MPPEEDRVTAIGNMHKIFGEDRTWNSGDMIVDGQKHKQTKRQTRSSQYFASTNAGKVINYSLQQLLLLLHRFNSLFSRTTRVSR